MFSYAVRDVTALGKFVYRSVAGDCRVIKVFFKAADVRAPWYCNTFRHAKTHTTRPCLILVSGTSRRLQPLRLVRKSDKNRKRLPQIEQNVPKTVLLASQEQHNSCCVKDEYMKETKSVCLISLLSISQQFLYCFFS